VALTKQMIWRFLSEPDPSAAERLDGLVFGWTTQSPDAKEGMRSFLEKRPPRWGMRVSTDVPDLDGFLKKK
jgi:enoyl-CoA hydratase/carnithine racemase